MWPSQVVRARSEYKQASEELALCIVDYTDLQQEIAKVEELGSGGLDEAGEKQLQERLKEKILAKQRAINAVHTKEKELAIAEELCSSLKQDIQVCKAATKELMGKVEDVRSRRAQQDTPGMQVRTAAVDEDEHPLSPYC
jgi:hypothetical protein